MIKPWLIIDIETLGTGYNAPITAVAALNNEGAIFECRLDVMPQIKRGAEIDESTLMFWINQPPPAWMSLDITNTASYVRAQLRGLYTGGDVWTRGNDFDIPILGNYFKRYNIGTGRVWHNWHYADLHNVRTAQQLTGRNPDALKSHDPLQDCKDDSWIVERWYKILEQCAGMEIVSP